MSVLFKLIFMDQIDDVAAELQPIKGEQCIQVKLKDGLKETKLILTIAVSLINPSLLRLAFSFQFLTGRN